MPKFATKAADNMFCQARYEAAKFNERLSSREGAAEELGVDRTRLARIELGSVTPYPEEVLLMADIYRAHNLLVPAATDVQLNPFYKYHVEEVAVDLSENSGDIFKVGSVKTGKTDSKGNDIWQDTYSLSKPLLNKLAMAAGIQFNPHQTSSCQSDCGGTCRNQCFGQATTPIY